MRKLISTAFLTFAAAATPALAEDGFYYGVGLGYSSAVSDDGGLLGQESELDQAVVGVTFGYRWDRSAMFYGAELDTDLSFGQEFEDSLGGQTCAVGANGPYYCTHDLTARLRGVVGTQVGDYEMFGTLGFVAVKGISATNTLTTTDVTNTGYTIGLGAQREMAGGTARLELIYDLADTADDPTDGFVITEPNYEAITLKATWMF